MDGQKVGSLYYDLDIDDAKLGKTLDSSDKQVKSFGDRVGQMGKTIQDGLNTAAKGLAVVGAGLTLYAKNATDFTVDLVKSSKSLGKEIGVTTTEASRLVAAFGRMGIDAQEASQMFGIFSKQIVAATENAGKNRLEADKLNISIAKTTAEIKATSDEIAKHGDKSGALTLKLRELNNTLASQKEQLKQSTDSFQKLGISTVDATGKQKDFQTILFEVADKFKDMPDGMDKSTIAMDLFGRSGKSMISTLNLGAAGIQDLEKQADKLGLTLNAKTIGAVNDLVKSQKDLKEQTDAMKIAVGTATAPIMTEFNKRINELVTGLLNAHEPLRSITVGFLAFGGPIADVAAGFLGLLANISSITMTVGKLALGLSVGLLVIAAVGGAIYLLVQHFGGLHNTMVAITGVFNQVWAAVMPLAMAIWNWLQPSIMAIGQSLQYMLWPALQKIWAAVVQLWNALNPALSYALAAIAIIIGSVLLTALYVLINVIVLVIQWIADWVNRIATVIGWLASLANWLGAVAGSVINFVNTARAWFGSLPGTIGNIVNQVVNWFAGMPGRIGGVISGVAGAITAPFRAAFNAVSGLWNRSIGSLNFNVPGWVPGIGGRGWTMPKMPTLAEGGIVDSPTIAMIGEAGREAVVPLSQLDRYNTLFSRIEDTANNLKQNGDGGEGGNTTNFNAPIHIYKDADAEGVLAIISRNQEIAGRGLTALRTTP